MNSIETDYLVIGSGAVGLAFTDTLLDESDAHVTIVDRRGKPGGNWNDAYSFVTLHQPSAFYGVNSMELGSRRKDTIGLNKGLYELASGPEISGYYDRLMNHKLLPSGRVAYHPMCNHLGDGEFESILSGERTRVHVRRKLVDATCFSPSIPSTHTPRFEVAPGVRLVPPNALPRLWADQRQGSLPRRFVVVGAGKTAMDAAVWLMQAGASPDTIQWVMPRDSWLINRITTQPAVEFFNEAIGGQADQMEACARATSTDDLFLRLEACGALMRIHPERTPTMFHLATIAPGEAEVLRRIRDVVRLGRVQAITSDQMLLDQGRVPVAPGTLFIDCTASAVEPRPTQPIFRGPGRLRGSALRRHREEEHPLRHCAFPAHDGRLPAGLDGEHDESVSVGQGQGTARVGAGEPARRLRQADDGHRPRRHRETGHHGPLQARCRRRDGEPAEADPRLSGGPHRPQA
jgi:NAD(P)-binding Rossmann-like domain